MNNKSLRTFLLFYLGSVVLIHVALFWSTRKLIVRGYPDFAIYYCAGDVVRHGLGHQLYDPAPRFEVERQFAPYVPQFRGPLPYTHPPFETLFFLPFSYLSWTRAYVAWNLVNLALLTSIPFLLRPHLIALGTYSTVYWMLAMLAFFPVPYGLLNGQDAILVLFFFTLVFAAFRKGRFASAGIFLGLGLFKFHFILPFLVLWLLQRRNVGERVRLLLGFISTAVVLGLVSLKVAGVRSISAYPKYVLWWEDYMAGPDKVPAGMPSLRGLLYIFLPSGFDYHAILLILSIGLFAAVVWMSRRDSAARSLDLNFSLALLFTAVTSYHVVSYDLSMLLLSIGLTANYYLSGHGARGWPARAFLLCTCAMFFSPLQIYLSVVSKKYGLIAIVLLVWMFATGSELMQKKKATLIGNGAGAAS